jgi:2,4-dichlorophenol 6-monooxygenase
MAPIIDVPVIIIGGGGCGLMLSNCLSDLNVEHMLFEKHPGTSLLPKAHYLNQRSMETFRHWGLGKKIEAAACPPNHMCRIEFRTSLGGTGIYDRHLLCSVPLSGLDPGSEDWNVYKYRSCALQMNTC